MRRETGHRSVVLVFVLVYMPPVGDMSCCSRCQVKVRFLGIVGGGKKVVLESQLRGLCLITCDIISGVRCLAKGKINVVCLEQWLRYHSLRLHHDHE